MWPALRSEFLATFGLVLLGTGACVVDGATGALGPYGVGAAWGASVLLMAGLSGAQMNPAASLALSLLGRQDGRVSALHAAAQCSGALAGSLLLKLLAGRHAGSLGATLPHAGVPAAFAAEGLMTFVLLAAALSSPPARAPYVAGAVVALEAALGGAISGASMNPARSLAPAVVSGLHDGLWIYIAAPAAGAGAAALWLKSPRVRRAADRLRPAGAAHQPQA